MPMQDCRPQRRVLPQSGYVLRLLSPVPVKETTDCLDASKPAITVSRLHAPTMRWRRTMVRCSSKRPLLSAMVVPLVVVPRSCLNTARRTFFRLSVTRSGVTKRMLSVGKFSGQSPVGHASPITIQPTRPKSGIAPAGHALGSHSEKMVPSSS